MNDKDAGSPWLQGMLDDRAGELDVSAGQVDRLIMTSVRVSRRRRRVARTGAVLGVAGIVIAVGVPVSQALRRSDGGRRSTVTAAQPAPSQTAVPPRWSTQYAGYLLQQTQDCLNAAGVTTQISGDGVQVTSGNVDPLLLARCRTAGGAPVLRSQLSTAELTDLYTALRGEVECLTAAGVRVAAAPGVGAWIAATREGAQTWDPYAEASPTAVVECPEP